MSRINTNIASLGAQITLQRNQTDLSLRLQRLATGLKINAGKDAPAGLIASEKLRSEINGIQQAVVNSARAANVLNTAEGALSEVSALLLQLQSLTNEAANTGALSPDEIAANQLQADAILTSINRIANTTQFNGVKLINGGLDYVTSGVSTSALANVRVYAAKLPDNGNIAIAVRVLASARTGTMAFTGAGIGAVPTTIAVQGNLGVQQITFAASTVNSAIVAAINQYRSTTGVSASLSGSAVRLDSMTYGSKSFVQVQTISGSFLSGKQFGVDAQVNINGILASTDGLTASIRTSDLDVTLDLTAAFGQQTVNTTAFLVIGGGAKFQIGPTVNPSGQVHMGIQSVAATSLGNDIVGKLSSLGSGGENSLIGGNTVQAQRILTEAIRQVSTLRGRLGAFLKNIVDTNVNSLNVALENVTASESQIRDADFAAETAALTRAQILVQANTSVLSQANAAPQSVLSLLAGR
ncbi:MAG: flagellin [Tepidisphaerales bacterium]